MSIPYPGFIGTRSGFSAYANTTWVSGAEVVEVAYTAFTSRTKSEQVPRRLVVWRIPELNSKADTGQLTLFDTHRFHAFFTISSLDTVTVVVRSSSRSTLI